MQHLFCFIHSFPSTFCCPVLIALVKQVHGEVSCPSHQDVLEEWLNCQCSWLYLEPIFRSEDIKRQLPVESERFQMMDTDWRIIMKNANENPEVSALINRSYPKFLGAVSHKSVIQFALQ